MENDSDSRVITIGSGTGRRVRNELRAYWEALRKGRAVPPRSEVNPRGIERALEFSFVLERVAPGMGRFRLAGMHLNDLMGMEVRGMPLSALFAPEGRKQIAKITEAVFSDPAIAEVELCAETSIGKPEMMARLLILPLTSDFGDVSRALGCFVAEGEIGRTPRRFEVTNVRMTKIEIQAQPATETPAPLRPNLQGFSETQTPFGKPPMQNVSAPKSPREHLAEMTPDERRAMFRIVREPT
ncbi:PAS domain-containing protein [Thioclava sp. 15-R06ZXC-3]|uniref:PAS domain-containing protein n=1 Tax=Thioclava arctica TaxID=3238301 RepID=A0ABV3TL34_9RHOB